VTTGSGQPAPAPSVSERPDPIRSVALIHYAAPPVIGGVERVLARHAVLMADAGHEVRVIAGRGRAPGPRVRFVRLPLLDARHPVIERIQVSLDGGEVPPDFADVKGTIASELGAALDGADVVIAHNVCSLGLNLALTAALRTVTGRPGSPRLILWHHDLAWAMPAYRATLHEGLPWDLLRTAWPGAAQVVVSAARRDDLAAIAGIPPSEIELVPNGVDLETLWRLGRRTMSLLERTGALRSAPLLLMPSRITRRKNVELALRVIATMRASGRPAGLIVTGPVDPHQAGGDAYLRELQVLRRELGIEDAAWFLSAEMGGPPSDAVMGDLYRLADLLFLPSRDEGFGLPILEAAAHRLPIVCTDLAALRPLAGDAALYVGADDNPQQVAERILARLDGDPAARLATEVRTRYTWDAVYRERIAPLLWPGASQAGSGVRGAV
jgi:glycosyltransferase involved in cell wall biosynthesis